MLHLSFKRFQNKYTGKGGLTTFVQSFRLKTNNTMNVPWRLLNKQVKLEKKNAAMIVFFRIICYSRKKQMSRQLIWFVIMKFNSTGTSVLFRLISRQCVSCSAPFSFPGIFACVVDETLAVQTQSKVAVTWTRCTVYVGVSRTGCQDLQLWKQRSAEAK